MLFPADDLWTGPGDLKSYESRCISHEQSLLIQFSLSFFRFVQFAVQSSSYSSKAIIGSCP
jgi:hypothetical protein